MKTPQPASGIAAQNADDQEPGIDTCSNPAGLTNLENSAENVGKPSEERCKCHHVSQTCLRKRRSNIVLNAQSCAKLRDVSVYRKGLPRGCKLLVRKRGSMVYRKHSIRLLAMCPKQTTKSVARSRPAPPLRIPPRARCSTHRRVAVVRSHEQATGVG
jgi:hypothetical protein